MHNDKTDETIGRFLLSALPDKTRLSYKLLAGFEFPLNDYASLKDQISERQKDAQWGEDRRGAAASVLANLTPDDFPIATVQGALEKYYFRIPFVDPSRFFGYGGTLPQVEYEEYWLDYWKLFGLGRQWPWCHSVAYRAFLEAVRSGMDEISAFFVGYRAGRRCLES